jgi:hypothetical protein
MSLPRVHIHTGQPHPLLSPERDRSGSNSIQAQPKEPE